MGYFMPQTSIEHHIGLRRNFLLLRSLLHSPLHSRAYIYLRNLESDYTEGNFIRRLHFIYPKSTTLNPDKRMYQIDIDRILRIISISAIIRSYTHLFLPTFIIIVPIWNTSSSIRDDTP